jgi:hypothetical protein
LFAQDTPHQLPLDYLSQILRGTQSQDCAPSGLNVRLADSAVAL